MTDDRRKIVLLDPVEPGLEPAYCVHGKTPCIKCGDWCWLGDKTIDAVSSGDLAAVCLPCGRELLPQDVAAKPVGRIKDHRRANGPHA